MIESYTFKNWLSKEVVTYVISKLTLITGPNSCGKSYLLQDILQNIKSPDIYLLNCKNTLGSLYIYSTYNFDQALELPIINSYKHQLNIFDLYCQVFPGEKLIETNKGVEFEDQQGSRYKTYELSPAKKQVIQLFDFLTSKINPCVVMIDDFGVFLHPKNQILLLNVLKHKFSSHQFILTSHSSDILSQFDTDNKIIIK